MLRFRILILVAVAASVPTVLAYNWATCIGLGRFTTDYCTDLFTAQCCSSLWPNDKCCRPHRCWPYVSSSYSVTTCTGYTDTKCCSTTPVYGQDSCCNQRQFDYTRSSSSPSSSSGVIGAIVGGVVGGLVFLILIIVIPIVACGACATNRSGGTTTTVFATNQVQPQSGYNQAPGYQPHMQGYPQPAMQAGYAQPAMQGNGQPAMQGNAQPPPYNPQQGNSLGQGQPQQPGMVDPAYPPKY